MLRELNIKDFGIFANEQLNFSNGLTIISGETGAGKSLIVSALLLLIGGRATSEDVRSGADEAQLEAIFDFTEPRTGQWLKAKLQEFGLPDEVSPLLLRRTLSASGRSRSFINGVTVTATQLAELGEQLIDFSGQHEQQVLLNEDRHREFLDTYGGSAKIFTDYQAIFFHLERLNQDLAQLQAKSSQATERADYLNFRVAELKKLELKHGEKEEIEAKLARIQHASKLFELAQISLQRLSDAEAAVVPQLKLLKRDLEKSLQYDKSLELELKNLNEATNTLDETSRFFQQYLQQLNFDPSERDHLEARLFKLTDVCRKYGSIENARRDLQGMEGELLGLTNVASDIAEINQEIVKKKQELLAVGRTLSEKRHQAAGKLAKTLSRELNELSMPGANLQIRLDPNAGEPSEVGLEAVQFLFSANPGEPPKALSKIASGGELSRLLLALKLINPDKAVAKSSPLYIFDEIDSGIGGRQAEAVGRKIKRLAQREQVICITHLAQIAVFSDQHLSVSKATKNQRTLAEAKLLTAAEREQELARMLTGAKITEASLAHARELLQNAIVP